MKSAAGIRGTDRPSDAELLRRVAGRDREALHSLYLAYFGRLGRFLTRVTTRPEVIEEIINDTMLAVWNQAGRFRGDSRPSTWIFGIAYRLALKAMRRSRQSLHAPIEDLPEGTLAEVDEALGDLLERAEVDDWLGRALERLSPEHRLAVELAYFMGLSCREIAEVADCPEGTVKTRMFYARRYLAGILEELAEPATGRRGTEE